MIRQLRLLCCIICVHLSVQAQDPVFSQYFLFPETMNPGFSGFMETTYLGIIHRAQWPELGLKLDTQYGFMNTWIEEMNSGVGVNIISHKENFADYRFTQVNFNYAYRVKLNEDWFFRPAIEYGLVTKSYDFSDLTLQDQINISSGSVLFSSIDPLAYNDKTTYNDFGAGMVFNNESFWFGLSMKHINRPNISFVKNPDAKLERFFSFNTGYEIRLSDHFDLFNLPYETSLLIASNYMQQGDFSRLDLAASLLFERLILGATVVSNPNKIDSKSHLVTSLNFLMGLQYEKFRFAFSYDANVSRIGQTKGVFEFSLTYQFDLNIKCFGCPNYGRLMR